jgi:hypothetical protein
MKNSITRKQRTTRGIRKIAAVTALATAVTIALPQAAHAQHATPPLVPDKLQVPKGSELFLVGHATGTQNYVCAPKGPGVDWSLFTPEATLFKDVDLEHQVVTHFFSPNPSEGGAIRATWQDSRDTSVFWGNAVAVATSATDPDFVAPNAIAWVRLDRAGVQVGPGGGDHLSQTAHVQRLNTAGGLPPSTGCLELKDLGNRAFIPYTADYLFYTDPAVTNREHN